MHEPRPERNAGQFRRVVQEREPEPVGEYPVGGELITGHGARPGKVLVWRGPQRLLGRCQVPDLNAVAGRDGRRAARRVGGEDDHAHRRDRPDLAEDARYALVEGLLTAVPGRDQRFHVDDHRPEGQLPGLGEQVG